MTQPLRRLTAGTVIVALVLWFSTGAAAAHSGPGGEEQPTTNYRTTITSFEPPAGVVLRVIDAGVRLELVNTSGRDVVIPGYEKEPYLRVGPDGVFENVRSPATYLNANRNGGFDPPPEADAKAAPEWRRISDGTTARWHDHRAHWMGGTPADVLADPDREHVITEEWTVPVIVDGQRYEALGSTVWVPGPTGLAWVALIAAIALCVAATALARRSAVALAIAAVALIAVCIADAIGTWGATSDPAFMKVAALITPALGLMFVVVGLVLVPKRRRDGLMLVAGGAGGLFLLFGWESRGFLTESQIPTSLDPTVARTCVALALGLGAGVVLAGLVALRSDLQPLWTTTTPAKGRRRLRLTHTRKTRA